MNAVQTRQQCSVLMQCMRNKLNHLETREWNLEPKYLSFETLHYTTLHYTTQQRERERNKYPTITTYSYTQFTGLDINFISYLPCRASRGKINLPGTISWLLKLFTIRTN